jgi:O-methyltransferase domain
MDVAGGHGLLLATVLRRHKTMRAVLFDLPHVAAGAAATFARLALPAECESKAATSSKNCHRVPTRSS